MFNNIKTTFSRAKKGLANVVGIIGVLFFILMMIVPMPGFVLDFLMVINLAMTIIIVMIVLMNKNVVDFSAFPQMLLVTTIFGLGLNISSTRLILSKGKEFDGTVVRAFASFVAGGGEDSVTSLIIGSIIFVIIVAVQLVVLTKGATRVAEVAARFTLDGMATKSMGIDQEFAQGVITEEEAKRKKALLQKESDFFGSMDGATKFVSGNAKIGILITAINLIGGLIVGLTRMNYDFNEAINTYLILTIGDGLVSQFPALFVNVATGFIVTRANSDDSFGEEIKEQFSRESIIYYVAGAFMILLGIFIKAFQWYIFVPVGLGLIGAGYLIGRGNKKKEIEKKEAMAAVTTKKPENTDPVAVPPPDILVIEIGFGLVSFCQNGGADLLDRITKVRSNILTELGVKVPKIGIRDNQSLMPTEYSIKLRGIEVGNGVIERNCYLAIQGANVIDPLEEGKKTVDPTFGLPAIWIREDQKASAERRGYTVVDGPSIIVTHLSTVIKDNAAELLGRQDVSNYIEFLRKDYPAVVEDLLKALDLGEIQQVIHLLLDEYISIRNIIPILETLTDYAPINRDPYFLCNKVRQKLAKQIVHPFIENKNELNVLTIDTGLDQHLFDTSVKTGNGPMPGTSPLVARKMIDSYLQQAENLGMSASQLPLVVSDETRWVVKRIFEGSIPNLSIFSYSEIPSGIKTKFLGKIEVEEENR